MPNLGFSEILLILAIVLVMFGATRLPQLGRGLGEGIRNFRKGLKEASEDEASSPSDEPLAKKD